MDNQEAKRFAVVRFNQVLTCQMNVPYAVALYKFIRSKGEVDPSLYALTERIGNILFQMDKIHLLKDVEEKGEEKGKEEKG